MLDWSDGSSSHLPKLYANNQHKFKTNKNNISNNFSFVHTVLCAAKEKVRKNTKANIDNVRRSYANVNSVAVCESFTKN